MIVFVCVLLTVEEGLTLFYSKLSSCNVIVYLQEKLTDFKAVVRLIFCWDHDLVCFTPFSLLSFRVLSPSGLGDHIAFEDSFGLFYVSLPPSSCVTRFL